jgi:glycerophosphoryl diester phosphodiesterase
VILANVAAEYLDHPRPLAFAHRGGAARQPENTLVWTLNTRAGIERALDLGADGAMTDEVELLRDILAERGEWHPRVLMRPAETSRAPVNC